MDGDPVERCWSGVVKRASGGYLVGGMSGKLVPVERTMHLGEESTCSSTSCERQEGTYSMMDGLIEAVDRFFRCMPCIVDFRLGVEE